jgi:ankyrin repeat protein
MNREWQEANNHADLEKVRLLIHEGGDINSKDGHGQTALMNAAHAGQVELVRLLIEMGADLNVTAKYRLSALMLSLIADPADLNIQGSGSFFRYTAFSLAEHRGHRDIAALLQQKGAIGQK